ncbi:DUF2934 domain-containing protein [Bosea sp. RAF48]|uniref:DUF2934 domain-containing protein n=1 Tax=Bosea sp. RAF48 TaxID=3237480 RepID=UPI003F8DDCA2
MTDELDREAQVRTIAYELWEGDGRPVGAELRHWDAAREILAKRELTALGEDPTLMPSSAAAPESETYARPAAGEPALSMEGQAAAPALSEQKRPDKAPRRRSKPA